MPVSVGRRPGSRSPAAWRAARYAIRLVRFALYFDPATMTVGHAVEREAPRGIDVPIIGRPLA